MRPDPAIARALSLDSSKTTALSISRHGGSGFSSTFRITFNRDLETGECEEDFFMKTAPGRDAEIMFRGEHASLNAIHDVVPSLCPRSVAHGVLDDERGTAFLVTEYLHLSSSSRGGNSHGSGLSLAAKLAQLHTAPAPVPDGESPTPVFGFPVPTCCGDTLQVNDYRETWADFYAHNRLLAIIARYERANGKDAELRSMVENIVDVIVPRLLRDGHHLDRGKKITPVVVHGDLWSGNKGSGIIGSSGGIEEVVFDPSACYASSEYEWGIMKMFGGFGKEFVNEYHKIRPKMEPVAEYDDRIRLYTLYHQLNHATIFGNSYRAGAVSIMWDLQRKYSGEK